MMKIYLSKTHAEEDGALADEGKLGVIIGSKNDIKRLSEFLYSVSEYLESNEYCHMHFRDSFKDWNKENHIDIEINVDER